MIWQNFGKNSLDAQNKNGDQNRFSAEVTTALTEQVKVPIHLWYILMFCEEENDNNEKQMMASPYREIIKCYFRGIIIKKICLFTICPKWKKEILKKCYIMNIYFVEIHI